MPLGNRIYSQVIKCSYLLVHWAVVLFFYWYQFSCVLRLSLGVISESNVLFCWKQCIILITLILMNYTAVNTAKIEPFVLKLFSMVLKSNWILVFLVDLLLKFHDWLHTLSLDYWQKWPIIQWTLLKNILLTFQFFYINVFNFGIFGPFFGSARPINFREKVILTMHPQI